MDMVAGDSAICFGSVGKWLNADPIGLAGGLNLYAYAANDPVSRMDPWGLKPGDVYSSPQAAANDALTEAWAYSAPQVREYAGVIYSTNGGYTYTAPFPGSSPSAGAPAVTSNPFALLVGGFNNIVATYHTHPMIDTNGQPTTDPAASLYESNSFSLQDVNNAVSLQAYENQYNGGQQTYAFVATPQAGFLENTPVGGPIIFPTITPPEVPNNGSKCP